MVVGFPIQEMALFVQAVQAQRWMVGVVVAAYSSNLGQVVCACFDEIHQAAPSSPSHASDRETRPARRIT